MKNKKTIFGVVIGIIVVIAIVFGGIFLAKDKDVAKAPETVPTVDESLSSRKELKQSEVKEKYTNLVSTNKYEVLRAEQISQLDTELTLFLDIKVEKPLSEDDFKNLSIKAHDTLSKDLKGKEGLITVFLNVFTSKEAFDATQVEDYKGEFIEGYVQASTTSTESGKVVSMITFTDVNLNKDIKELDTSLAFDVVNTIKDNENQSVQLDVVITDGTATQINDLFQSLIGMVIESNEGIKDVSLRAFTSTDYYKSGSYKYEYSTLYPTNLTKRVDIQF